ncbi:hypothetical protein FOCG_18504 [Fusarium oxysporum f. sp. radicis-lycopersici 26381]|nr:hypothetical protein FOCG_18504 [Fusarium oxysporum f. sp. radicis-lycopersici 26381]
MAEDTILRLLPASSGYWHAMRVGWYGIVRPFPNRTRGKWYVVCAQQC